MKTIGHFINNETVAGTGAERLPVFNPATGAQTGAVAVATAAEIEAAIAAARAAFPAWAATPPLRRARIMFRFKELVEQHKDELAKAITLEHGKVISDAGGEVVRGLEVVEFACGIPELLKGDYSRNVGTNIDSYSFRAPLGVVAGITPFNFPVMVPMWMFPMAIACGNCFILKPSEKDPSPGLLLAELLKEAGLPAGVFNVINGDRTAVDALLTDPRIAAVSFVGSTPIAEHIYRTASHHGKRVQALGGAKNHMIVMPDADLDQAVDALIGAAYGSAGERCMAISVAVAVGGIADPLVERIASRARSLKVGPGLDPEAEMGPLITREHQAKVESYIEAGIAEGARLVVDGRGLRLQGHEDGHFVGPTLFDHVRPGMKIHREEIFGPVLSVVREANFDGAVRIINEHEFGNGTSIFTRDGDAARSFADQIEVGMVGINVPIPVPMAFHSFGGWKRSAFGDHGMHGHEGVHFYTKLKTMTSRWPTGIRAGAEFAIPTMR
ncbi:MULTISPECIES: CoA-acylating methylmalonate-semialdehyde dehydrogenase [Acidiphilium]|jgi:malonate-semialdehyde dehydrogenase (acetylating)/methylmalonate-semialdehyde dehydrogenase|uniref:methylmalonate-semialdehyde dehydrogenase (CoA acylating) n=2 Tax=Acidiphilium TaxID=522 RepID=F0IXE7_ACIMA|nr:MULTISPECIES: CoA-acylating methylmalonate-semialdehyde dehydrogenase [Acidiphilium]MBU6355159.1 CoA-acylating methylmalonate-semialdehyde dehydrogenase [Rhodospirillales bacterium]EGO94052.1 Methylmalonate-semialdehyde dehydrogenase [Acidiphilium sp. PM]MBS3023550.1 CoA-acylating methylmalonate-semialdehyde dehydrogenase [Acidiphilium multivorum]BAJ82712.1 methylmalonate-semialdehyde dehydrogenase [Acidiphilium multivorum AIU301]GAN75169.1 aldehyde/methylmalonate-semialdehyde dehydrogenase